MRLVLAGTAARLASGSSSRLRIKGSKVYGLDKHRQAKQGLPAMSCRVQSIGALGSGCFWAAHCSQEGRTGTRISQPLRFQTPKP